MAETISGILKSVSKGRLAVRTAQRSYRPERFEVMVQKNLVREFGLAEGVAVTGGTERRNGRKRLISVESLGGISPEAFNERPHFTELVAIDPSERSTQIGRAPDPDQTLATKPTDRFGQGRGGSPLATGGTHSSATSFREPRSGAANSQVVS